MTNETSTTPNPDFAPPAQFYCRLPEKIKLREDHDTTKVARAGVQIFLRRKLDEMLGERVGQINVSDKDGRTCKVQISQITAEQRMKIGDFIQSAELAQIDPPGKIEETVEVFTPSSVQE